MTQDPLSWQQSRAITPEKLAIARQVLEAVRQGQDAFQAIRRFPLADGGYLAKHVLVAAYRQLVASGEWSADPALLAQIRMKPTRTLSGVATVTVLTRPHPCPGQCIFCPDEVCLPKSYLMGEPGAMRGLQNDFDPYQQVASRLESLDAVGHPTDKIELLLLGGTWSAYPRSYQEMFIRRCFDAMNGGAPAATLQEAHLRNETAAHRNVGLVIETRPDEINPAELAWLRELGVTKVQLGAQSLDDDILDRNRRGHRAADTLRATALLRAAGFKIVLHWMPNLLGATPASDAADFARLWQGYCPDEIKIYPTQLLQNTALYAYWQRGEYRPYTTEQLVTLIADLKAHIPPYCRVNRIIRDIPSDQVVAGNKRTSLRQDVLAEMARRGTQCNCIRCREVRSEAVALETLRLEDITYPAAYAEEHFLSYVTPSGRLAGYLRLGLPHAGPGTPAEALGFADLRQAALVREVHVYGQSLPVGGEQAGAAQHIGLGARLLEEAARLAAQNGYRRLAVIAAIGTRPYYQRRGFTLGERYMLRELD